MRLGSKTSRECSLFQEFSCTFWFSVWKINQLEGSKSRPPSGEELASPLLCTNQRLESCSSYSFKCKTYSLLAQTLGWSWNKFSVFRTGTKYSFRLWLCSWRWEASASFCSLLFCSAITSRKMMAVLSLKGIGRNSWRFPFLDWGSNRCRNLSKSLFLNKFVWLFWIHFENRVSLATGFWWLLKAIL